MSNDNSSNGSTDPRLDGVSIRVNGVIHGAREHYENRYHVTGKSQPTAIVRGTANEVNTFVAFNETNIGDMSQVQPFADSAEMHEAFRDPRYRTSAAFRLEVGRRSLAMRRAQG